MDELAKDLHYLAILTNWPSKKLTAVIYFFGLKIWIFEIFFSKILDERPVKVLDFLNG
jgi:hypothetical protein